MWFKLGHMKDGYVQTHYCEVELYSRMWSPKRKTNYIFIEKLIHIE